MKGASVLVFLIASALSAEAQHVTPPVVLPPLRPAPQQNIYVYPTVDARPRVGTVLLSGAMDGLFQMAIESERSKNQAALYDKILQAQKDAAEKPIRMMWAIKFRAQMRPSQPEWQINHWLRERGVDPAELDMWEAAFSMSPIPAQPTAQPVAQIPPTTKTLSPTESEKIAEAAKLELAGKIRDEMVAAGATDTQIQKRLRSLGVNPAALPTKSGTR